MKKAAILYVIAAVVFMSAPAGSAEMSAGTKVCVSCHSYATPGIYYDWKSSRHAAASPEEGLAKPKLERRVNDKIPASMMKTSVGCFECHTQNKDKHTDNFNHFGVDVNIVVSPNDCRVCHEDET